MALCCLGYEQACGHCCCDILTEVHCMAEECVLDPSSSWESVGITLQRHGGRLDPLVSSSLWASVAAARVPTEWKAVIFSVARHCRWLLCFGRSETGTSLCSSDPTVRINS